MPRKNPPRKPPLLERVYERRRVHRDNRENEVPLIYYEEFDFMVKPAQFGSVKMNALLISKRGKIVAALDEPSLEEIMEDSRRQGVDNMPEIGHMWIFYWLVTHGYIRTGWEGNTQYRTSPHGMGSEGFPNTLTRSTFKRRKPKK